MTINTINQERIQTLATELKSASKERIEAIKIELTNIIAEELKPEAIEVVRELENDTRKTTKGNYGKYMNLLSNMKGIYFYAMVKALKDNGAGMGLNNAVTIIKLSKDTK